MAAVRADQLVVAENSWIDGRVVREGGSPAAGIRIVSTLKERDSIPVEHGSYLTVTGADGTFRFPAVDGAPYVLHVEPLQFYPIDFEVPAPIEARGGTADVLFTLPVMGRIVLCPVDAESGEPVPCALYELRWYHRGPQGTGGSPLDGRPPSLPVYLPEERPEGAANVVLFPTPTRFVVPLPSPEMVDPGGGVQILIQAAGYETTSLVIDELGRDLGEREVSLRPVPSEGWSLEIRAQYENGTPYSGKVRVYENRAGIEVRQLDLDIHDGVGLAEDLIPGIDYVVVGLYGGQAQGASRLVPCPTAPGQRRVVEITARWRLTLVVDPDFVGGSSRMLRIRILEKPVVIRSGRWPSTTRLLELGASRITLVFSDSQGEIVREQVEVVRGKPVIVRPRIPAGRGDPIR